MAAQVEEMMRTQQELNEAAADSSAADGEEKQARTRRPRAVGRSTRGLADELAALEETLRQKAEELGAEDAEERSAAAEAMREALERPSKS